MWPCATGRILGVGPLDELAGWGTYTLDDTLRRQGADAGPRRGPQPCRRRHLLALHLSRALRPHGPRRQGVAGRRVHRGRRDAPAGSRTPARISDGRARRLGPRSDLLRRPPRRARRLRPCLDDARGRRDACERPHLQRQHPRAGTGRTAAAGRQPSRYSARRRRPADRRTEGPRRDDDRGRACRLRPRGAGQRRRRACVASPGSACARASPPRPISRTCCRTTPSR